MTFFITSSSINSYADDSTFYYSFHFEQQLIFTRKMILEQLTSDLSRISNWGRENMVVGNVSKLNFSISLLDIIFHTIMTSSFKTLNSNLHLSSIFSVFLFLRIFLWKITLLLFLNKLLSDWVFWGASELLHTTPVACSLGALFAPVWSTHRTSGVVPLIQLSTWKGGV